MNQGSFVSAVYLLFVFFDLYCVYVCIFVIYVEFFPYCLFVSNSQVVGCEDRLWNELYCVGWGVKLYSIQSFLPPVHPSNFRAAPTFFSVCLFIILRQADCYRRREFEAVSAEAAEGPPILPGQGWGTQVYSGLMLCMKNIFYFSLMFSKYLWGYSCIKNLPVALLLI